MNRTKNKNNNNNNSSKLVHPNNKHPNNNINNNTRRKRHPIRYGRAPKAASNKNPAFSVKEGENRNSVVGALRPHIDVLTFPNLNSNYKKPVHFLQHMTYPEAWEVAKTSKQLLETVRAFPFTNSETPIKHIRAWRDTFPTAIALRLSKRADIEEFIGVAQEGRLRDLKILIFPDYFLGKEEYPIIFATALPHLTALTALYLWNNHIGKEGAIALASALPSLTALTELYLNNSSIGDAGMIALATTLPALTVLLTLDLRNNTISNTGAIALARVLPTLKVLKELYLSNNNIHDAGLIALATTLPKTLTYLGVDDNQVGDAGFFALAASLPSLRVLTELDVSRNRISIRAKEAIRAALPKQYGPRVFF
jgi:hypothetical protein